MTLVVPVQPWESQYAPGGLELDASPAVVERYCTWRAISWSDGGGGESLEEPGGKRDEAVMVSDAFGDRSRRGSRSPERRDRGRKKPRSAFVATFRDSEARNPGNTARGSRRAVVSESRRCAMTPGFVPPADGRVEPPRPRALERHARARDRIARGRRGGEGKTARLGSGDGASRSPAFANARSRDDDRSVGRSRRSGRRGARSAQCGAPIASRASRAAILEKAVTSKRASSRSRETRARAGEETHLLPWGCHTIMGWCWRPCRWGHGALLRTGATAEKRPF